MAAGELPARRAAAAPGRDSADEAEHLLALAESELSAGRLQTARRPALRASRLHPSCAHATAVVAATNVLLADASSHHAALLLHDPDDPDASPLSASELRRHFRSLVRTLRVGLGPDFAAAYPSSADAAEEALCRATEAYEALTAGTFWTACAGCRLLHEFQRKYVGYRLICPSCRRKFLAVEVPPPPEAEPPPRAPSPAPRQPPPAKKPEKLEMTLAEMQLQLSKKRMGANAPESSLRDELVLDDDDDDEDAGEEVEAENNHSDSDLMAVEDSDFYNFDANRGERCFKRGQVWALYADDGMPRHYALVAGVQRATKFRVRIWWLDGEEEGKPCGQFKVGRAETVDSVNVFSHIVACVRVGRKVYHVHPRKASVWALHGGNGEEGDVGRTKYDIVVMLSGYVEWCGASFGYLKKVEGFRSIFTRRDAGSVHLLQKGDLGALSHQIPARKVPEGEGLALPPGDCWGLDPAALPPELLRVEASNHGNDPVVV